MYVVIGGTGQIGAHVTRALLDAGVRPTVICRDRARAHALEARGATVASVDIADTATLAEVLTRAERVFALNPPGDPAADAEAAERRTVSRIVTAIAEADPDAVVALSTYGARDAAGIGDLGTLHALEHGLASLPAPVDVVRAAYFMSNWAMQLDDARRSSVLHSFFPLDRPLPMVAPADVGAAAARRMVARPAGALTHVEGPDRYTPRDVAAAFSRVLGRDVEAQLIPREAWVATMQSVGFSRASAASFAGMMDAAIASTWPPSEAVERGPTTLDAYVEGLVQS
jgi:uncharacterized protein YbjT (DUF2867 family)